MLLTPLFFFLMGLLPQPQPQRGGGGNFVNPQTQGVAVACSSELRWINNSQKFYNLNSPFTVNLFSAVGKGCTPAEIRVFAMYLDPDDNIICTGSVDNVAQIDQNTQSTILEFKPLITLEFVRWRNVQRAIQPVPRRLPCIGPDQLTEVSRNETDRATSVRIFITLLAGSGGMSNVEVRVDPRQARF